MTESVGPYQLVKKIAVGGAAEIYLARKAGALGFEQFYALKLLLPHHREDPEHRKMMVDEARLTAQFDHPNIVKVHDLGEDGETLFLVMEYVSGLNLAQLLALSKDRGIPIPIETAVYITREACAALHYAHTRRGMDGTLLNLVHRDVSPQNILVSFGGEVKLIDFGVAKASIGGRLETKTGIIKGKLTYMAPEYAIGSQQDRKSDIFAAGLCLYEMLVGRAAYDIEDPRELVEAVKHARIDRPSTIRPEVDQELEKLLARAVEVAPQNRWNTAEEFQDQLTSHLSRKSPHYRKETLAAWFGELRSHSDGSNRSLRTEHGLPALEDADTDISDVVATQSSTIAKSDGPAHKPRREAQNTTFGMPAGGPTTEGGTATTEDEPLSLADLANLDDDDYDPYDDDANLATIALDPDDAANQEDDYANAEVDTGMLDYDDQDVATGRLEFDLPDKSTDITEEAGTPVQIRREFLEDVDIATLPTGHLDVEDIAPERTGTKSELPTATNIDVDQIRGDMIQKVPQPNRPQILTQSGFQQFADRPELHNIVVDPMGHTAAYDPVGEADPMEQTLAQPAYQQGDSQQQPQQHQPQQTQPQQTQPQQHQPQQNQPQQHQPPAAAPPQAFQQQQPVVYPKVDAPPTTGVPAQRRTPGLVPPEHQQSSGQLTSMIFALLGLGLLLVLAWILV